MSKHFRAVPFLRSVGIARRPSETAFSVLGGAPFSAVLPFAMTPQTELQWCWAATSASVAMFFVPSSGWVQCAVASKAFSIQCCGGASSGPTCNQPWYLNQALAIVGHLHHMTGQAEMFSTVQAEIAAGRPLCVRVGWSGDGGHFLAIHGWQVAADGVEYYHVDDPIFGKQTVERRKFETAYQHNGTWTHSYFLSASPSGAGVSLAMDFLEAIGA